MASYPIYDGPTTVTVGQSTQTLATAGKIAPSNITVNPAPYTTEVNSGGGMTVTIGGGAP